VHNVGVKLLTSIYVAALFLVVAGASELATVMAWPQGTLVESEFVFENAPFAACHASTIAETSAGLVVAWFAGRHEGSPDVGIWLARWDGKRWSTPVEVAGGVQPDGSRQPCWNPVLFQPRKGPLLLFYKVGPNPREWWCMLAKSADGGMTWTKPQALPQGFLGPIKNKPVELADGSLLLPSSTEHDNGDWRVHLEHARDDLRAWAMVGPFQGALQNQVIQPSILRYPSGRMQILCRNKNGNIAEAWSQDAGKNWSDLALTTLPNPNSGIDAASLRDGRTLLVYNHTRRGRTPLNVAVSRDGAAWTPALVLEDQPGEYSYPAVIQTRDGLVHISYTWKRERIKHVVLDPSKIH
jgi:predicted neuraminidase